MNEFDALCQQARAKRDSTIAHARKDYNETIKQIACLKRAVVGTNPLRSKSGSLREANCGPPGRPQDDNARDYRWRRGGTGYRTDMPKRGWHKYVKKVLRIDGLFKRVVTDEPVSFDENPGLQITILRD